MRKVLLFISLCILSNGYAQKVVIDGLWQGILIPASGDLKASAPFFMDVRDEGDRISGLTREEIYKTEHYAIGKFYGERDSLGFSFNHVVYNKKTGGSRTTWCKLEGDLKFDAKTGYLEGDFRSTDCRNKAGRIVLYRSKHSFSKDDKLIASHGSRDQLVEDLLNGRPSPDVRSEMRKNFKFQPIFFDYDKDSIRPEYFPFLERIVEIVDGHTDLRVKVVGNTDSDGSAEYNEDLSKRRAQSIIDFFVSKGISEDRLVIEFHGESKPIDTNQTDEGKQKNRRVEFSFI